MANYYVDPQVVGGLNDGSSWANAWNSLQLALNTCVIGDVVYCKGSEAPTTTLQYAGTGNAQLYIIGCNSSGVDDGTLFTIDGANISTYLNSAVLSLWGANYVRNVEIKNSSFNAIACYGALTGMNLYIHDNAGYAFARSNMSMQLFHTTIMRNGGISIYSCNMRFCYVAYNTKNPQGYTLSNSTSFGILIGNILAKNSGKIEISGGISGMFHNVIYGQVGHGVSVSAECLIMYGNRIVNCVGYGVYQSAGSIIVEDSNFIYGNTMGPYLKEAGADWLTEGNTKYTGVPGFTDPENDNYNLLPFATNRDIPVNIDGTSMHYFCSGLLPQLDKKILTTRSKSYKPAGMWRGNR